MKTIQKYGQLFLSRAIICLLFFVLTLPCSAQDAAGVDGKVETAQAADVELPAADDDEEEDASFDLEDDTAKPVFTVSGKIETLHGVRWNDAKKISNTEHPVRLPG